MPWAAAAAAAAAIGGGALQADASKSAAQTQAAGSRAAADEQAREFNTTQTQTGPYRSAGASGMITLRSMLGIPDLSSSGGKVDYGGQNFNSINDLRKSLVDDYVTKKGFDPSDPNGAANAGVNDPAYQSSLQAVLDKATPSASSGVSPETSPLMRKFSISDFWNDPVVQASYQSGLDLGTKALKNAAPLTTGLDSGAALKELTKFGTDYTGNMAAGSQARFVNDQGNQFNRLAALTGIGQTAVGTSTQAGMNAANNTSNIIAANANAQGAAKIAGANAFGGGMNSIANYWQQQQMLNSLKGGGGTTSNGYNNPTANYSWADLNAG